MANPIKAVKDLYHAKSGTGSLPDVAKVYAKMSEEAYNDPKARKKEIGGFEYLKVKSLYISRTGISSRARHN